MADILKEAVDSIGKEIEWIAREFGYLKTLKTILEVETKRLASIKDETVRRLSEESLKRRCRKIMRKVGRTEVRTEQFRNKAINFLKDLDEMLNRKYGLANQNLLNQIDVAANKLLILASSKNGEIKKLIEQNNFNNQLISDINDALSKGIMPLEAVLRRIKEFLEKNKKILETEIKAVNTYVVNTDAYVREAGAKADAIVLIDASFVYNMEDARKRFGKEYYDLNIKARKVVIPEEVYKEMSKRKAIIGAPLIRSDTRNFLTSVLGAKVERVERRKETVNEIVDAWERTTKGSLAVAHDKAKFYSGDMDLLSYARQSAPIPVRILSNDNDIIGIVRTLKRENKMRHVIVYSFLDGRLQPTA